MYWIPSLLYAAAIVWLSHQSRPPGTGIGPDYLLHAIEYGGLALTLLWGWTRGLKSIPSPANLAALWAGTVIFAVSDEVHQGFIPDRHASLQDVLADAVGAGLVLIVSFYLLSCKGKRYREHR